MVNKTIKIYGVFPTSNTGNPNEFIIDASKKKDYLSYKFWKESLEDAQLFRLYYIAPYFNGLPRIVGILSGEYLRKGQNIEQANVKIHKAIHLFAPHWGLMGQTDIDVKHLKKIVQEVYNGFKNSELDTNKTLDEILEWASNKSVFSKKTLQKARDKILSTRKPIFAQKHLNKSAFEIIKPFLKHKLPIYYEDAKALLFPENDLLHKLTQAVQKKEVIAYGAGHDNNPYYFDPSSLIKWLIKHNYLPDWIVNEFRELWIELINESQVEPPYNFDTLEKLSKKSIDFDRNDLLQASINGKFSIYLKYPRDDIYWKSVEEFIDPNLPKIRYLGYGQLKSKKEDQTYVIGGIFGGVTLDMILHGEEGSHALKNHHCDQYHHIELMPTQEEAKYGLQPYIKIPKTELANAISDQKLVILKEDIKHFEDELKRNEAETVTPSPRTGQILSRPAIKNLYTKKSSDAWDKAFNNANKNGLAKALVPTNNKKDYRYDQEMLHQWLIENGIYTPGELTKFSSNFSHNKSSEKMPTKSLAEDIRGYAVKKTDNY